MTQTRRTRLAALGGWLSRYPYVLPLMILVSGAAFRFFNLDWDHGHQLHPDERWIYMVVSGANGNPPLSWPSSLSQLLSVQPRTGSPLDPHFFAYGSLPFYLLALVAGAASTLGQHVSWFSSWATADTYGQLPMLGRGLSATLDLAAQVVLFLIGRRIYGYWTGVLAMALGAFTVLDIQLAHFYTVDTVLLPLALLTLLACVTIVQTNRRSAYIWGGVVFGAAMASKTTALLLVIPLISAALLAAWNSQPWPGEGSMWARLRRHYGAIAAELNENLQWVLGSLFIAAGTFAICEPYGILDRAQLVHDIAEQNAILVRNDPPFGVPYTIQYAHTIPYLYQLKNLLFWCMGIPLGLAAFGGVLFALIRNLKVRVRTDEAVLLLWVLPYFLFVGSFFAKFNRYMLPITPVATLLGAALLVRLIVVCRGRWRVLAWGAMAAVTGVSFLYSLAYMHIYEQPNSRVAASRWILTHIPPGTKIAIEGPWDDALPLEELGRTGAQYPNPISLDLYAADDQHKIANITDALTHAQYIIMSSERLIGSIPRLPDRYPMTTRYYKLLLSGRLNFRLERVFQAHPQLGPIVVQDYGADESFHVYDHPIVRIFRRVSAITPPEVAALLTGPNGSGPVSSQAAPSGQRTAQLQPDKRLMLSQKQWRADQSGPTMDQMFPPNGFAMQHPTLVWLLMVEILGLAAFPFTFVLLANLIDGGFCVAKTVGLILVGYGVWLAVRLQLTTFDSGLILCVLAALLVASCLLAYRMRASLAAFFRQQWRMVAAGELVFLAAFAAFVLLRMWYPDLGHQFSPVSPLNVGEGRMGEKQMELAFLNAIVRSRVFPPYDPFFAHGYINYYYYGFFLVGMLCKLTQIAPATGFNLAIATFFALLAANVFSAVLSLTRRVTAGITASIFVAVLGNLNGAWQVIRGLMSLSTVQWSVPVLGGALDILSGLQHAVFDRQPLPPFDFWEPTRIVPPAGGPITEFPYFTYLFADLHPHLMAYPMTAAALAVAVSLVRGAYPSVWRAAMAALLAGLLAGAIAVTNPWDFPTYVGVIALGAVVGAYTVRRRLEWKALRWPVVWIASLGVVSFVLYLPFKRDYQTVFETGIGLTRDITPQMLQSSNIPSDQMRDVLLTPLRIYLEHFGLFLFVILSYLTILLLYDAGVARWIGRRATAVRFAAYYRDRPARLYRACRIVRRMIRRKEPVLDGSVLAGVAVLVAGLAILHDMLLAFLLALLGLAVLLLLRLARQLSGSELFVLALLILPIVLSIATQIVFVKDWLAGGSDFRMNTIFKFYNQVWVLYAVAAAAGLHFLTLRRSGVEQPGDVAGGSVAALHPDGADESSAGGRGDYLPLSGSSPVPHTFAVSLGASIPAASSPAQVLGTAPRDGWSAADVAERSEVLEDGSHVGPVSRLTKGWNRAMERPLTLGRLHPVWSACLILLLAASAIYPYVGTISRETYRTTWLKENSVPWTLDGMAFMKTAYPGDYAGIEWLNAHVHGAQVIAEADDAYYNWRSRVSMFTGLPTIINGIHEGEQRYSDEIDPSTLCDATRDPAACRERTHSRPDDLATLYNSPRIDEAWRVIHTYGVRYIFVGFSERQCAQHLCYARAGLEKFEHMVGHGLTIAYRHPGVTIYEVSSA